MTISRKGLRAFAVALAVVLTQGLTVAAPAMACACGALEPATGEPALVVDGETALVRHDGSTEDILLSFGLGSDSSSAALILPLPAKAELSLADTDTFESLADLTKPRLVEHKVLRGLRFPVIGGAAAPGGDGAQGSGVDVLDERELGPFTTTQLDSDEAGDLRDWLEEHDYRVRDEVVEATQPYLDEGWVIAAIQLRPGADGLEGDLQPIRATFASDEMVYPMRLQANAESPMPLRVYALAEHRQDLSLGAATPRLRFAGSLDPASVRAGSTLAELTEGTPYLTRHDLTVRPEHATTDVTLTAHADDATYREETVVEVDYPWFVRIFVPSAGTIAFWVVVLPPLLLSAAFVRGCVRLILGPRRS